MHRKHKRFLIGSSVAGFLAAFAAVLGLAVSSAGSAGAATHSNGVYAGTLNTAGEAGYLAYPNIGDTSFKQIQSTMYLRVAAEQIGSEGLTPAQYEGPVIPVSDFHGQFGAMGLEACNGLETVQIGFILNADGTFDVVYAYGTSTVSDTHCAASGLLDNISGDVHVLASGVPDGSAYALLIKRGQGGFNSVRLEAQNLTNGTTVASGWIPWAHSFSEVSASVLADPHLMTTSLDNELLAVRHTNITNLAGTTSDFGGTSQWTADQVAGVSSGKTFLSPKGSLSGATFKVWGGQPVV